MKPGGGGGISHPIQEHPLKAYARFLCNALGAQKQGSIPDLTSGQMSPDRIAGRVL